LHLGRDVYGAALNLFGFRHVTRDVFRPVKTLIPAGIQRQVTNFENGLIEKTELSENDRDHLFEIYRSDVLALQALLQRDLSCWLD
jgi:hypothetical protein